MRGTLVLLLVAGFETTVNLIGNGTRALLDHPAQWKLFKANPELASAVVEETLRWAPPVQMTSRIAHEQVHRIGKGEVVTLLIGAANRDPEVYPEPHKFDVMRVHKPEHLAFSSGIHYCLGATLARMEGEVAFRALARRMPGLRQTGPVTFRDSVVIRGLKRFRSAGLDLRPGVGVPRLGVVAEVLGERELRQLFVRRVDRRVVQQLLVDQRLRGGVGAAVPDGVGQRRARLRAQDVVDEPVRVPGVRRVLR